MTSGLPITTTTRHLNRCWSPPGKFFFRDHFAQAVASSHDVKTPKSSPDSTVLDLMPYAAPCAVIVAIIDAWTEDKPPIREMDEAMRALDALAPLPGPTGQAIRLFTTSDAIAPDRFAEAVTALRRIAALSPTKEERPRRPAWKRRPQPSANSSQETLWPT
jgi:hypothetical protein